MAIIRMINTRDPGAFREFQSRMVTVGKIRLGTYNGRYPEKLSTFRFTSEDGDKVRAAAAAYGGTAEQWTPQGSKTPQWEVISEAKEIPVYIVNGQGLDPWYEAWAGGRTCVRRCDGVTNKITDTPCVCIPADGTPPKISQKELCKPTIRVQVMLAEIPGLGSWLMESHGENACAEISTFGPLVAAARTQIPAVLRLREESRREWNPDKKGGPGFESKSFYVPWFDISAITMQQVAVGGDALTQALRVAGGSAALSAGPAQAAIEARPVSAPVPPPVAPRPVPADVDKLRPMILADIELQETVEGLNAIKDKLKSRGINDQRIIDAWVSKANTLTAAAGLAEVQRMNAAAIASGLNAMRKEDLADAVDALPPADRDLLKAALAPAGRPTAAELGDDVPRVLPFPSEAEMNAAEAGKTPCCGGYRTPDEKWSPCEPCPIMEARATLEQVNDQFAADLDAAITGTVEDAPGRVALPDVPEGDYDADELYTMLMTGASQQNPPLTTPEVNGLICRVFGVPTVSSASGADLARLRAGLKSGAVTWR